MNQAQAQHSYRRIMWAAYVTSLVDVGKRPMWDRYVTGLVRFPIEGHQSDDSWPKGIRAYPSLSACLCDFCCRLRIQALQEKDRRPGT